MDRNEFAKILFDETDKICVCPYEYDKGREVSRERFAESPGQFFVINAVDGGRKGENATSFRNFFIEFDDMELEKQLEYVKSLGMPYSTCVFSGKKSYHFIVSLETPLANREQYDHYAAYLHNVVSRADHSTKSCTKLSRYPNVRRTDTQKLQEVKEIKGRIKNDDFFSWLEGFQNCIPKKFESNSKSSVTGRESVIEVLDWYVTEYLKTSYNEKGVRTYVKCPICSDEGCDTHEDNMCITHSTMYFGCFKDKDHNRSQLARMISLRREFGNDPAEDEWKKHNEAKQKEAEHKTIVEKQPFTAIFPEKSKATAEEIWEAIVEANKEKS